MHAAVWNLQPTQPYENHQFKKFGINFLKEIDQHIFSANISEDGATITSQNITQLWSRKQNQFFVSDISLSVVNFALNNRHGPTEIRYAQHLCTIDFRKIGYQLFCRESTSEFFWFIQKSSATNVDNVPKHWFRKFGFCSGCVAVVSVTSLYLQQYVITKIEHGIQSFTTHFIAVSSPSPKSFPFLAESFWLDWFWSSNL